MNTTDDLNELFVVVDREDNIIGYETRKECHSDKSLIHRAAYVVIHNSEGKVLLQKRSMTKDKDPGKYTVSVGGHVGKGETYQTAALREMREELGIETDITYFQKFIKDADDETEMDAIFTALYDGEFSINETEVSEVRFFSKAEIADMRNLLTYGAVLVLQKLDII